MAKVRTQEECKKRLDRLMELYPHIDHNRHIKDLALCHEYLNGNREPFEVMFQVAYRKMENYIKKNGFGEQYGIHISIQDKEDIAADAAIAAIMQMDMFHGWSLYSTWMQAIARYRILRLIQKRCAEMRYLTNEPFDDIMRANPSPSYEDSTKVWEILSALPELEQEIVRLKAVELLTYEEISQHMGISKGRIIARYTKAIKILRQVIAGD